MTPEEMTKRVMEIKKIHDLTGVGLSAAKQALEEHGNFDKALEDMRLKGLAKAQSRTDKETDVGVIYSYTHNHRIGVLVEVNCETDFVAKTEDFLNFAKDIALQIAASKPLYITPADIPQSILDKDKDLLKQQALKEGISEDKLEKVIEGRLEKDISQTCLLKQVFNKDPQLTVEDLLQSLIAKLGENIVIQRFARFELGQSQAQIYPIQNQQEH